MTKEEILTAIQQALSGQQILDPDGGFITKVKELNTGDYVTFWVGSRAEYNALGGNIQKNCIYIMNDDTSASDLEKKLKRLEEKAESALLASGFNNAVQFDPVLTLRFIGGENAAAMECNIQDCSYTYIQTEGNRGMVFFTVVIGFKGSFFSGNSMELEHLGSFKPISSKFLTPCHAVVESSESAIFPHFAARLDGFYKGSKLTIYNGDDSVFSNGGYVSIVVSGQYETLGEN
jgi:hypothetical protein